MRTRFVLIVVAFVALPLFATEWQPVSQSRPIVPAAYNQINAYAVSDGADYLVTSATVDPSRVGAIQYVTAVNADGTVPEPANWANWRGPIGVTPSLFAFGESAEHCATGNCRRVSCRAGRKTACGATSSNGAGAPRETLGR